MTSEVVAVTSEVMEASPPRHRGRRKVRRWWRLSWLPAVSSLALLVLFLHNARYSAAAHAQSDPLRLTLLDVESDGGPLDEHSIAKRKIGDVAGIGQNLGLIYYPTIS